jgi:hypothetical protein
MLSSDDLAWIGEQLALIHRLLVEFRHAWQADYVSGLITLRQRQDAEGFLSGITSNSFWGGAGAVWELFLPATRAKDTPRTDAAQESFRDAIAQIGVTLLAAGIDFPRAEYNARYGTT